MESHIQYVVCWLKNFLLRFILLSQYYIRDGCFRTLRGRCVDSLNSISGAKTPKHRFHCVFGWLIVSSAWRASKGFLNNNLDACVRKYLYGACSVVSIKWYLHERDRISVRALQRKWPWMWVYGANSSKLWLYSWFICLLQCLRARKIVTVDKKVKWNMPNATIWIAWKAFQPASQQTRPHCEFTVSLFVLKRSEYVLLSAHKIFSPFRGFVILKNVGKDLR